MTNYHFTAADIAKLRKAVNSESPFQQMGRTGSIQSQVWLGVADAAIASGDSGDFTIWRFSTDDNTEMASAETVTAKDWLVQGIAEGGSAYILYAPNEDKGSSTGYYFIKDTGDDIDSTKKLYGKATANWYKETTGCHYVTVNPCLCDGSSTDTGTTHTVYFTNDEYQHPNVITGNIIAYHLTKTGTYHCDKQDRFIGCVELIKDNIAIPQGWNCFTDLEDKFAMGACSEGQIGETGGADSFTVPEINTSTEYITGITGYFSYAGSGNVSITPSCIEVATGTGINVASCDTISNILIDVAGSGNISVIDLSGHYHTVPSQIIPYLPPYRKIRYIERINNAQNA